MANCKWFLGGLLALLTLACQAAVPPTPFVNQPPTLQPTPTLQLPPALQPTATAAPPLDSGWELLQPGLERRTVEVLMENGRPAEQLYLLRIDPDLFVFRLAYSPGAPKTLATWQAETDALLVLNGGFFTEAYVATGLIVVDRQVSGSSYVSFGGMVTMGEEGLEVRSLRERPYQSTETFDYALQAFPMLVLNGEAAYQNPDLDRARRTVVGVAEDGRILLILATRGSFTLAELSSTLASADFGLVNALNLDGGTSTGLVLADPPETIPAFVAVPSVILVSPK